MADLFGVVWTRAQGSPCKVADMVLTEREHRLSLTGEAPYSLIASKAGLQQITYPSREGVWFEPHIQAMLPQSATLHHSLIQARAMAQADAAVWRSASPREQAWLMLLATGHGNAGFSIGHLDVFASDEAAQHAYAVDIAVSANTPAQPASALLDLVADYIASPSAAPTLLTPLGNVASVGGMMPKILACIAVDSAQQWDGVLFAPNAQCLMSPRGKQWVSVLVKFEPKGSAGLLALENACYAIHREAGLSCPATWLGEVSLNGRQLTALCSERFDRSDLPAGLPLPFASFAAVLHSGNPSKYLHRTDAKMDDLPQLLRVLSSQPAKDAQALYLRYVLALLTGNGDAHLDNWGMLGRYPNAVLSPVYDPAPMRAFGYNCVSALPLGAANHDWTAGYLPSNLAQRLNDWAKALGLRADTVKKLTLRGLIVTQTYPAQVQALWHPQNPEFSEVFLHRIAQVRAQLKV